MESVLASGLVTLAFLGWVLLLAGCAGSGYYNDKGQWVGTDVAGALTRPDPTISMPRDGHRFMQTKSA